MKFIQQPLDEGAKELVSFLLHELKQNKTVLWLLSGGSNIKVAATVMKQLLGHEQKLIISLVDERYGPIGHKDSNWQQLIDAGFKSGKATTYPVLQEGLSLQATARMFELTLEDCVAKADSVIAIMGIGPDGHTSGILPHSPATKKTEALVLGYQTEQYDRITTTFAGLKKLDVVFCLAYGAEKKQALLSLKQDLPLEEQPAQILKSIKTVYLYNDVIGENS